MAIFGSYRNLVFELDLLVGENGTWYGNRVGGMVGVLGNWEGGKADLC